MSDSTESLRDVQQDPRLKTEELRSFLFLTAVIVPVLSVIVVAGYGFIVWMTQLIGGPPTH